MRLLHSLLVTGLLALAACSGDDAGAEPGRTTIPLAVTTAPPAASGTTLVPTVTTEQPAASTTAAAATTTVQPVDTVATTFSGSRDSEWCLRAAELNILTAEFRGLDAGDADAVRAALAGILTRIDAIEAVVPDALATDLTVSADAFRLLDAALAASGYDFAAADLGELDARTDAIAAANARIRTYNHDVCGLDAGLTGDEEHVP